MALRSTPLFEAGLESALWAERIAEEATRRAIRAQIFIGEGRRKAGK
jgi:hypothetical protein